MAHSKGTILITGANGGLGAAMVKRVVSRPELAGYIGLYMVRDPTAAPALRSALAGQSSHQHDILPIDLTNLGSIRQAAQTINARISAGDIPPIRALICNAGYQNISGQTVGEDLLDPTFTVNYLGHWLFVVLLLRSMDRESGRIVMVGSQTHDPRSMVNRSIIPNPFPEKILINGEETFEAIARGTWSSYSENSSWRSGYRRYGAAKLCLMMMLHELQCRVNRDPSLSNICVLSVDPGSMTTGLQRHAPWLLRFLVFQLLFPVFTWLMPNGPIRRPDTSASHVLRASFESGGDLGEFPKGLYFDGLKPAETSAESRDARKSFILWRESVKLTRLKEGETILLDWQ